MLKSHADDVAAVVRQKEAANHPIVRVRGNNSDRVSWVVEVIGEPLFINILLEEHPSYSGYTRVRIDKRTMMFE